MAALYSANYGIWGEGASQPTGSAIKLTASRIKSYAAHEDTLIAQAFHGEELVGYAIVILHKVPNLGMVSWVTQFVVHRDHRNKKIGKKLLFSAWTMSDHYAWGILTSNPYAVRALEAATRRRCQPKLIRKRFPALLAACANSVPYIETSTETKMDSKTAQANTNFAVSHEGLADMISSVTTESKPWTLGDLTPRWEWVAFTFRSQEQEHLSAEDIEQMLAASDQVTKEAYARMQITSDQKWSQQTTYETAFIEKHLELRPGTKVLDFGCGNGRHCIALQKNGVAVTGVDYNNITAGPRSFPFVHGDCRTVSLERSFDAGLCLYDVVGSYANDYSNYAILANLRKHLNKNAYCLISVMSLEYTQSVAKHFGNFGDNPDVLLALSPSNTMEATGNVFNGDYFFLDTSSSVVYRKEQFEAGSQLPAELIVRDKRYDRGAIQQLCERAGFKVIWIRQVKAGAWDQDDSKSGKEHLVLCQAINKPEEPSLF